MLINDNTVRHYDNELAHVGKMGQSILNFLINDIELINWHEGVIFIQNKVVDSFLAGNLLHLTEVIDHSSRSEKLEMKQ